VPSNSFHNKSLCTKAFYSSSETVLIDDENSNTENDDTKSLKINVMRDLKSAQKLKSAFTNSKYSKSFRSFNDSKSHSGGGGGGGGGGGRSGGISSPASPSNQPLAQSFIKKMSKTSSKSFKTQDDTYQSYNQHKSDQKESFTNIKRSQTFSVPANSYGKTRSNTTSILPIQNTDNSLIDPCSDFNMTDSPTNSQSSFYNDSRISSNTNYNHQGIYIQKYIVVRCCSVSSFFCI
jgi:hypothetical protein